MHSIMKFKIYSLMLCAGLLTATSCSDMLDTVPQGQFVEDQLDDNSVEGLVAAKIGRASCRERV